MAMTTVSKKRTFPANGIETPVYLEAFFDSNNLPIRYIIKMENGDILIDEIIPNVTKKIPANGIEIPVYLETFFDSKNNLPVRYIVKTENGDILIDKFQ